MVAFPRGKPFHVFFLPLQLQTQLLEVLKALSPPSTTKSEEKSPFYGRQHRSTRGGYRFYLTQGVFLRRFVKVNSQTNPSTFSLYW